MSASKAVPVTPKTSRRQSGCDCTRKRARAQTEQLAWPFPSLCSWAHWAILVFLRMRRDSARSNRTWSSHLRALRCTTCRLAASALALRICIDCPTCSEFDCLIHGRFECCDELDSEGPVYGVSRRISLHCLGQSASTGHGSVGARAAPQPRRDIRQLGHAGRRSGHGRRATERCSGDCVDGSDTRPAYVAQPICCAE